MYQNFIIKLKFGKANTYVFKSRNNQVLFDTSSIYAKKWFYATSSHQENLYETSVTKYLEENLKPDSCFFDIGAHIGYYTCIAAKILDKGEVHSFEVDQNCQEYLAKNIQINDLDNVKVNYVAVSDKNTGESIPAIKDPNNKINIFVHDFKEKQVKSTTIDDYISLNNVQPNFIKIDVEAAECLVLRGMSKTLQAKPLTLLIEVHNKSLKRLGFSSSEILDLLRSHDFKIYKLKHFRNNNVEKVEVLDSLDPENDEFIIAEK